MLRCITLDNKGGGYNFVVFSLQFSIPEYEYLFLIHFNIFNHSIICQLFSDHRV